MQEKDFSKIEIKNNICTNFFCYENRLTFPIQMSSQTFKDSMDLLQPFDGDKLEYVYIKDFNKFTFLKTMNKNKKYFCKSCLPCFSSKNVFTEHKKVCLSFNGGQSV